MSEFKRLTKASFYFWGSNVFFLVGCVAAVLWFIIRVSTKPSRITYPCQRATLQRMPILFAGLIGACSGVVLLTKKQRVLQLVCGLFVVLLISFSALLLCAEESNGVPVSLVSFKHDTAVRYGDALPPYDPVTNPAYAFVWSAIDALDLGPSDNPLRELIHPGDTVLIKPNMISAIAPAYTRPEIVRPLIDMAICAGAKKIHVGDGSTSFVYTEKCYEDTGYRAMISALSRKHPEVSISLVNLNDRTAWRWVLLDEEDSFFYNSGYRDRDLMSNKKAIYKSPYYNTADPYGINPKKRCMGAYAFSEYVLNADVVINVPKLKSHRVMVMTGCLKAHVGSVVASTFSDTEWNAERIPHYQRGWDLFFDNDVLWRVCYDLNHIIIYGDKKGVLQPEPQRRYLNVVDAIIGGERSNVPKGGIASARSNAIIAGEDPLAVDCVVSRIMGYDYRFIPTIKNLLAKPNVKIGTGDWERILVVADAINEEINDLYAFNKKWKKEADALPLAIRDFVPPLFDYSYTVDSDGLTVSIKSDERTSVYFLAYKKNEQMVYARVVERDGELSGRIDARNISSFRIYAHDQYFNTSSVVVPISVAK